MTIIKKLDIKKHKTWVSALKIPNAFGKLGNPSFPIKKIHLVLTGTTMTKLLQIVLPKTY